MERRSVVVTFEGPKVGVEFEGVWTRAQVDTAHRIMLLNLPKHLSKIRQEMEESHGKGSERQGERTIRRKG